MGKQEEKTKKKKGRPSLIDLQKRSLRLQQKNEDEPSPKSTQNPNSNRHVTPPLRRSARTTKTATDDADDDDEEIGGRRREKKLKLVLRLHQNKRGDGKKEEACSDSESSLRESKNDGGDNCEEKKVDEVVVAEIVPEKNETCSSSPKIVEVDQSEPVVTTPLPDKKLLVFILDRLQKKDIYAVFSEPVDPNELPDYHDVIKHPMDFSTVRNRLSDGYYKSLEMFEKDVYLICTNAMSYNAPDTIYFRQAKSIQELARKDFENLRQVSEEEEPEPKIVRRGRPPGKSMFKKLASRSPGDRAGVDFSDATLANAGDNTLPGPNSSHDSNHRFFNGEGPAWMGDKSAEDSGSFWRMKIGRKVSVSDENRRHTYNQPISSKGWEEPPVLAVLDGERRQLVPVGLHGEHAYAKSLARFAANLGPHGWEMASRLIKKSLPPGTKFGPGWVGEPELHWQHPSSSSSPNVAASLPPPPKSSFQSVNGVNSPVSSGMVQFGRLVQAAQPVTHTSALEMVSRVSALKESPPTRGLSSSLPPDLNVRFQSPSSPPSAGAVDLQQPDLALQL